ncbi:PTS sugar transporter subunit IIB [Mycoplasmopsis gallinacea]|uniref:PTS sugar transporter subunit IIB n=1 Tax=Mycoplasmopsis gallinacea TaxID=29556 RepID=A0A6H0V626_9BACT|nr:PTS sugar transporter subunit IIB [Mycoplasmopsis gallinacea]QIW62487.1 PTS sugar transporter subunit IIB [Mycoplasmopsis gallinacea]
MKVLLICSGGMSTQILISSLEKEASKLNLDNFSAKAIGTNEIEEFEGDFDIVLVAPQIKHKYSQIEEFAVSKNKKIYQIQITEYSPIGASKLIQNILKTMES